MSNVKIRDSANSAIKRYMKASEENVLAIDSEQVEAYIQLLNEQWERFKTAQEAVEISCGVETLPMEETVRIQTETWYVQAISNFKRMLPPNARPQAAQNLPTLSVAVKLPKMELPKFSGAPTEWTSFRDLFISLVHNNNTISNSQKLHYLRSCLEGEASRVVNLFEISDANYNQAWNLLHDRYQVMRIIVENHLSAMASIKFVTEDSASAIRAVVDSISQHVQALKALNRPVEFWDDWLVHLTVSKLSYETRKQWELSLETQDMPAFETLLNFLEIRCRSLEVMKKPKAKGTTKAFHVAEVTEQVNVATRSGNPQSCLSCGGDHKIYVCKQFNELSIPDRITLIKEKNACFNCLSLGHVYSSCRSESTCRACNARHHTMLHRNAALAPCLQSLPLSTTEQELTSHHSTAMRPILLCTAKILVQDYLGCWQPARVLFDNGSQTSLVTETCVLRLGLARNQSSVRITGIGSSEGGTTRGLATLTLSPRHSEEKFSINALILPKITNNVPGVTLRRQTWDHTVNLQLADPEFYRSSPIDVLIGMDEMEQFILPEMRKGASGTPIAQLTSFGWVLSGRTGESSENERSVMLCQADTELTRTVSKFWEIDQLPRQRFHSIEETMCEQHFESTHRRASDGRFIVQLPFKKNVPIGQTRDIAERSLLRMERRLSCDDVLHRQYKEFMRELIDLGHMEEATSCPCNAYYMPHHAVLKESSSTTKLRVVFNASQKSSSGFSLNDALMVGPQLQDDLFSILLRFRSWKYAMNADVEKMYRQVLVDRSHTEFQRILWRDAPTEEVKAYRLLRVTYGVASASYLAVKAMHQLAEEQHTTYTNAADSIIRDFYMDDLLTGASSEDKLLEIQSEIVRVLATGGFNLRKWASNSKLLSEGLAQESKEIPQFLADVDEVRTLGLNWHTSNDALTYSVNLSACKSQYTKREFLSDASRLFDPMGLLAPCTIKPKLLFQELWSANVNWDDPVPDRIVREWNSHRQDLTTITQLKIDRWMRFTERSATGELHVFSDASEKAYAAAVYARVITNDKAYVTLLAAKTKVAPLKTVSLPRLELCAAHLASQLIRKVSEALKDWNCKQFAWTDSTVTLAWLQGHPSRWSTFIANRVAAIQEVLPPEVWAHIPSAQNPSDCASRGVSPTYLLKHTLWWEGPELLRRHTNEWIHNLVEEHVTELELRSSTRKILVAEADSPWDLLSKFSKYSKLKRVVAYVRRFINNTRTKGGCRRLLGGLNADELQQAETALIRYTQCFYFSKEIRYCREKRPIPLKSVLIRLQPFLDDAGILRVGGRLKRLLAPYCAKHPAILPKDAAVSRLLINDIHLYTAHGGPQLMQTILQRKFWVIGARNLVRKIYRNCLKCRALNRAPMQQQMADLPLARLTYSRCFLRSAVDCAGPFMLKFSAGRGAKSTKGYVCSFICMTTGAMHLELVSDLSTAAFLNAFKRFINRRGLCQHLYSDNGTNFVGAERELHLMFEASIRDSRNASYFAESNIVWHFNPPAAPHMGGYWETGIKRIKYHLKRTLGDNLLTFEEFATLLTEVESCVNSRPLCVHASDVDDGEILTPGHFIIGEPLKSLPEPESDVYKCSLSERWQLLTDLRRYFWKRWKDEYVLSLQKRSKWYRPAANIERGDIVAVLGERTPPTKWKLGRVMRCIPGEDGLTRTVAIRTADGELLRPIHKLCLLPTKHDIFSI